MFSLGKLTGWGGESVEFLEESNELKAFNVVIAFLYASSFESRTHREEPVDDVTNDFSALSTGTEAC